MKNLKVSIIIPVYNGSNYLKEAIDSALAQTYKNKEILVVNDGSTDNGKTEEIAKSYGDKIHYYRKKNGGVATALNFGVKKMTGKYFSWLSHDDLYYPNKIAAEMDIIKISPIKTIVYCDMDLVDGNGQYIRSIRLKPVKKSVFIGELVKHNFLHGCGLLIPKSAFEYAGLFKSELHHTQDYDLWFRMFKTGYNFKLCPKVLIAGRQHLGQDSVKGNDAAIIEKDHLYNQVLNDFDPSKLFPRAQSISLGYMKMALYSKMLNLGESARTAHQLSRQNLHFKEYFTWSLQNIYYFLWNKFMTQAFYRLVQIVRRIKRRRVNRQKPIKTNKIKICFIGNINSSHNRKILCLLVEEKLFDIHFISTRVGELSGVKVYPIASKKFEPIAIWFLRFLLTTRKLVWQIKPDIVHGQSLTVGGIASFLSGFRPYIASAWGSDVMEYAPNPLIKKLVQASIRNATIVTGSSIALRSAVLAYGGDKKFFRLIRFGIDLNIFKPKSNNLRKKFGITKEKVIFCPRSIGPIYNSLVLLYAFKIVASEIDAVLVMIRSFENKKYFNDMINFIKKNKLEKKIIFVHKMSGREIADYYNFADVIVSIPKWDGASVSFIEALATGKKAVVTKLPYLKDWKEAKYWSCAVGNAKQSADKILEALKISDQDFKPMAGKNRALVVAEGEIKRNFDKLTDLYQEIVNLE